MNNHNNYASSEGLYEEMESFNLSFNIAYHLAMKIIFFPETISAYLSGEEWDWP
jgi:hypothetical protein|tara:strand:- start:176 stop:337 length:162 start_codon:yes stop_codon:yes gene_type:complete